MNKAIKLYNKNQFLKAKAILEELLAERGLDLKVLSFLTKIEYRMENYEECLQRCDFYLLLDFENKEIIKMKIAVLKMQKKMSELFDFLGFVQENCPVNLEMLAQEGI